jgi:hypothetical protein
MKCEDCKWCVERDVEIGGTKVTVVRQVCKNLCFVDMPHKRPYVEHDDFCPRFEARPENA